MGFLSGLFGGGNKSTSTSTATTNNNYDQRSVTDAGGGIVGNRNTIDRSNNYTADTYTATLDSSQRFTDNSDRSSRTSYSDSSDRSVDASQRFSDYSDRSSRSSYSDTRDQRVDASQRFSDTSDRRVAVDNRNITDGGAFDVVKSVADGVSAIGLGQIDLARDLASRADSMRSGATDFAIKAQEQAAGFADDTAGRAFDLARSSAAQAYASSGEALGFTRDTFADVIGLASKAVDQAGRQADDAASTAGAAYSSATNTASGNKTLIYMAIGAIALVGAIAAFKARGA